MDTHIHLCLDTENHLKYTGCTPENESGRELALNQSQKWDEKALLIKFLDGEQEIQQKVIHYALEWNKFANLPFIFDQLLPRTHIRISFKEKGAHWSLLGNQAMQVEEHLPTMNFGWYNASTPDEEIRRVVLHEFGHALGFVHEHQSPKFAYSWNEKLVIEYYRDTYGWHEEKTRHNILTKNSTWHVSSSPFDKDSIMCYHIPRILLQDGEDSLPLNTNLSIRDKSWARKWYPAEYTPSWAWSDLYKTGALAAVAYFVFKAFK